MLLIADETGCFDRIKENGGKDKMHKQLMIIIALLFVFYPIASVSGTLSADDIMKENSDRYRGDSRQSVSTLFLIDNKGHKRVRTLKTYAVENKDVEKTIIYFQTPSDVKGTAYMSFDWKSDDKEDDSWLYLPTLQKVKRVAASEKSRPFVGSDFSYADINGLNHEDFDHRIVKESEIVEGVDCWVVASVPKAKRVIDETGYTSATAWIRKDNFIQVKGIFNLEKGREVKYFSAGDVVKIDGIWTVKTMQMVTAKGGVKQHASVLKYSDIQYNQEIDGSRFDTQAMQRGI